MECVPACRTCTGLCRQPVPADTGKRTTVRPARGRGKRQADTHVPAKPAGYIHISCGHYDTPENQRRFAPSKPKGRKFWCEACSKWMPLWAGGKVNSITGHVQADADADGAEAEQLALELEQVPF